MKLRIFFKGVVRLAIEGNGNPLTMAIHISKKELFRWLDKVIPDETPAVK